MEIFTALRGRMKGKKTYLISLAIIGQSLIKLYYGDMNLYEFVVSPEVYHVLEGSGLASLRAGVQALLEQSKNSQ